MSLKIKFFWTSHAISVAGQVPFFVFEKLCLFPNGCSYLEMNNKIAFTAH